MSHRRRSGKTVIKLTENIARQNTLPVAVQYRVYIFFENSLMCVTRVRVIGLRVLNSLFENIRKTTTGCGVVEFVRYLYRVPGVYMYTILNVRRN